MMANTLVKLAFGTSAQKPEFQKKTLETETIFF